MTPPSKKRKIVDESKAQDDAALDDTEARKSQTSQHYDKKVDGEVSGDSQTGINSVDKNQERKERFKALQARAVSVLPTPLSDRLNANLCAAKVRSDQP